MDTQISRPTGIRLASVTVGAQEERLVIDVLRSGHLAQGPMVATFESQVAEAAGVGEAVAVSSGTTALIATLQALGIGPGDEVITAPLTFAATLNAILHVGATARFVDVTPDGNMDPERLVDALRRPAAAVIPVHLYGNPCPMVEISMIAADAGVAVIEDAAQAIGATVLGRPAGSFGTGCFSFYATKNVTTGEGGAITTDDPELARRLRLLRDQGMDGRYSYAVPGFNYRMTDLTAAIGVAQMTRLEDIVEARRRNATVLSEGLAGIPGVVLPSEDITRTHVYHQYVVRITDAAPVSRQQIIDGLKARGIESGIVYPKVVFDYACYRGHPGVLPSKVPAAAKMADEVLALPVHPGLSARDLDAIVSGVRETVRG